MGAYDNLDESILDNMQTGKEPVGIFTIWLAVKSASPVDNITILDRRMQALKKKSLVSNVRGKGWIKLNEDDSK